MQTNESTWCRIKRWFGTNTRRKFLYLWAIVCVAWSLIDMELRLIESFMLSSIIILPVWPIIKRGWAMIDAEREQEARKAELDYLARRIAEEQRNIDRQSSKASE